MKRYLHLAWYAVGLVSLLGLWLGWSWFREPMFPLVCFLSGRLTKYELKGKDTFFDRAFEGRWSTGLAIGSAVAVMIGITGWILYVQYISGPANMQAAKIEYLKEHAAMVKEGNK